MPSPFPGMDPYLENPHLWPDVHHGLISQIQAELNVQLRPKYRAGITQNIYVTQREEEIRDAYLAIVDTCTRETIVVVLALNQTNKDPASEGRAAYLELRNEILRSPTNLVEIDLLREGRPIIDGVRLPEHEYVIHVSRAKTRPQSAVWPIRLQQPLPKIPIPLTDTDIDVALDLQKVFDATYDRAAYGSRINYRAKPNPPLPPDLAAWAESVLKG